MNAMSIGVRYRPVRIGWCVESGQWEHLRSALRFTHAFAGGKFNPLIPVDRGQLGEYLVDRFRVDVLFPLRETEPIRKFIKAHGHLLWPNFGEEQLFHERWEHIPPYAAFVDVYHTARRIYEEKIRSVPEPKLRACLVDWLDDDPLADVLLAAVGAYPPASSAVPDYPSLLRDALRGEQLTIGRDDALPADLNRRLTPSRLCAEELEADGGSGDPGFYVGRADDFDDLLNFWNLRAAGIELVFFDPGHQARLAGMAETHRAWLRSLPPRPWREADRLVVWEREGAEGFDLSTLGAVGMRCSVGEHNWNGLNIRPGLRYWHEKSVVGSVDESDRTPSVTIALPERPVYQGPGFHEQYIGVSLSGFEGWFHDRNVTFFPPYVPDLNEYYGRHLYFHYAQARADIGLVGGAVGLLIPTSTADVTLRSLPSLELATQLFGRFGINAKPSQAGLVTSRLIAQMGGTQGCRVFKIEGVRTLVAKYGPAKTFQRTEANKTIGNFDEAKRRMRFEPYEDLFIGTRSMHSKLQPQHALDFLLERGVFRVGLDLKCPHCQLDFWLQLDDVKTKADCAYCGTPFDVTMQLRDRNWAYRRSGLFGREDHQQGGVPVAVCLQQLDTALSSMYGMLFTTSLMLTSHGAPIEACEVDFVAISRGPSQNSPNIPQLVVGECKSAGGEITAADGEHLRKIADALPRNRVNVFVLFAKTGTFTEAEIAACALAQGEWRPRVILLSKDELEPYHVYERHPKEPRLESHSFEALAQSTVALYPALRPKCRT